VGWGIERSNKSIPVWFIQNECMPIGQRFIGTGQGALNDKVGQGTVGSRRGDLQSPFRRDTQPEIKFFSTKSA